METTHSQRVQNLVEKLTVEEKISLLSGKNFWETQEIVRLGIPSLKVTDGPNGARGEIFHNGPTAACFPASVSLAAGWDIDAARRIGKGLAEETFTKGANALLAPTVCPHRHPLGGRNFESFSEDPLLAGKLSSQVIQGLQSSGVGATIKHFAANEQETRRLFMNSNVSERALREIYLKPFEIAIKEANPWAIMTSYNKVNGTHADANEFLLQRVLRNEWGWNGLVMSDWGGCNSLVEALNAGLSLEMPGTPLRNRDIEKTKKAIDSGKVTMGTIDTRTAEVLTFIEKAGKFEHPETPAEQSIINPEHGKLIREVGAAGMVLLKNDNNILPIQLQSSRKIALLGLAKECLAHGGGSAHVPAHYKITPYDALKAALPDNVELSYARGAHMHRTFEPLTATDGLQTLDGKPGLTVNLRAKGGEKFQGPESSPSTMYTSITTPFHEVFLEGTYTPTVGGNHYLQLSGMGLSKVFIDDELVLETHEDCDDPMAFFFGVVVQNSCRHEFTANKTYKIRIESAPPVTDSEALTLMSGTPGLKLGLMTEEAHAEDPLPAAVKAAESAELAIVFVGNTPAWETEGVDQTTMNLPAYGSLDRLIEGVAAANSNVVVVVSTGVPISMPWLDKVKAIVQTWYPGQEAGNSIADVLLGKVTPAGKLPMTFPKRIEDAPAHGNFPGDVKADEVFYKEGSFIGYRFYDEQPDRVLFPFGHGLSYTTFDWGDFQIESSGSELSSPDDKITVSASVKNSGSTVGSEVVQVYVGPPQSESRSIKVPLKKLVGFAKLANIPTGESSTTKVTFQLRDFADFDEQGGEWFVQAGKYNVILARTAAHKPEQTVELDIAQDVRWKP